MPRVAGAPGDKSGSALGSWGPPTSPSQLRSPRVCRERVAVLVVVCFFWSLFCRSGSRAHFVPGTVPRGLSLSLSPALYLSLSPSLLSSPSVNLPSIHSEHRQAATGLKPASRAPACALIPAFCPCWPQGTVWSTEDMVSSPGFRTGPGGPVSGPFRSLPGGHTEGRALDPPSGTWAAPPAVRTSCGKEGHRVTHVHVCNSVLKLCALSTASHENPMPASDR